MDVPLDWDEIDARLSNYGMISKDCGGHPDCFFLCISHLLHTLLNVDPPPSIDSLRRACAMRLRTEPPAEFISNFEHIRQIVNDTQRDLNVQTVFGYINDLERGTLYGGDVELGIVRDLFPELVIAVFSVGRDYETHPMNLTDTQKKENEKLGYVVRHGAHFRVAIPAPAV